jgi:hypothetical protein
MQDALSALQTTMQDAAVVLSDAVPWSFLGATDGGGQPHALPKGTVTSISRAGKLRSMEEPAGGLVTTHVADTPPHPQHSPSEDINSAKERRWCA